MNKFLQRYKYDLGEDRLAIYYLYLARYASNIIILILGTLTLVVMGTIYTIAFFINPDQFWSYVVITLPYIPIIFAAFIGFLPLYLLSNNQIIFDAETETVFRKTIFGVKLVAPFTEILEIKQVISGGGFFYAIKLKEGGKYIRISDGFTKMEHLNYFKKNVLTRINEMICI